MRYACNEARAAARGTSRRDVLRVGSLGALGLSLGDLLTLQQAGAAARDDYSCIMLWLTGGPSQFDSFDPKPDAPSEVRGPFKPISTNVDGVRFTEVFPQVAKHADKLAVLRSVYHPLDNHVLAQGWMTAGRAHDTMNYPPMGSVLARLEPGDGMLPPFVTLPRMKLIEGYNETQHFQTAGDLGAEFNPLIPDGIPGEAGFAVRDLPPAVSSGRFGRRERLLARVDPPLKGDGLRSPREGLQAVYRRAFDLIHSTKVRQAFDLEQEPGKLRDAYGRNGFGQAALLSRRLVEAGARFVTVNWP
ncbi:MAG: DUF1501 domain-containing protein, partial [Actinomycetota bacterium]